MCRLSPPLQNRRAKWRKREPPRKTGYIGTNSPSTNLGPPLGPPFLSQASTVSPPGSVDSWTSYQTTPYELTHFNLLSPASSPYGTFSSHQYGTYVHESQVFPMRQHFEYESPSRGGGGGVGGGIPTSDDPSSHHNKPDHYLPMDEGNNNACTDG